MASATGPVATPPAAGADDEDIDLKGKEIAAEWFYVDAFVTDLTETLETWKAVRERMERGKVRRQLGHGIKEIAEAREKFLALPQDSEKDRASFREDLVVKLKGLREKYGSAWEESVVVKKFKNDVFAMDDFYKSKKPIVSASDIKSVIAGNESISAALGGAGIPMASGVGGATVAAITATGSTRPNPALARNTSSRPGLGSASVGALSAGGSENSLRDQVERRAKRRESVRERQKDSLTAKALHHLVIDLKDVSIFVGQESQLVLSLYSLTDDKFLAEDCVIPLANQSPLKLDKAKKRAIFRDLPAASLEDVWLVCRLHRFGRLKYDATKQNLLLLSATASSSASSSSAAVYHGPGISSTDVRRPFAVAALALTDVLDNQAPNAHALNFFLPSHDDETLFPSLHQLIINDSRSDLSLLKAAGLTIHLRHFKGPWGGIQAANAPFFKRPGLLSRPLTLQEDDPRHDFFLTLEEGSFAEGKNVEVVLEPRTNEGQPVVGLTTAKSMVLARVSAPRWNEVFKYELDRYKDLDHLYLLLRNVTADGKFTEVGFAVLRLFNADRTFGTNGSKKLPVYRMPTSNKPQDSLAYLKEAPKQVLKSDFLRVATQLVSSKYSENVPLMSLINWKTSQQNISEVLIKCTLLEKKNIRQARPDPSLRFYKEILDALFEIMEIMPDVTHLAFNVLASVFAAVIVVDTAFSGVEVSNEALSLQALLEKYLEVQFHHPRAWGLLIDTLCKILADAKPKQASPPRAVAIALKSITFTMRFIIKSRREYHKQRKTPAAMTAGPTTTAVSSADVVDPLFATDEEFKAHVGQLLHHLIKLLDIHQPALLGIQTKLIRTFPNLLDSVRVLYDTAELASIVETFLDAFTPDSQTQLNIEKLLFLETYINSPLAPRYLVLEHVKRHLRQSKEEKLHAIRILTAVVKPHYQSLLVEQQKRWEAMGAGGISRSGRTLGSQKLPGASRIKIRSKDSPLEDLFKASSSSLDLPAGPSEGSGPGAADGGGEFAPVPKPKGPKKPKASTLGPSDPADKDKLKQKSTSKRALKVYSASGDSAATESEDEDSSTPRTKRKTKDKSKTLDKDSGEKDKEPKDKKEGKESKDKGGDPKDKDSAPKDSKPKDKEPKDKKDKESKDKGAKKAPEASSGAKRASVDSLGSSASSESPPVPATAATKKMNRKSFGLGDMRTLRAEASGHSSPLLAAFKPPSSDSLLSASTSTLNQSSSDGAAFEADLTNRILAKQNRENRKAQRRSLEIELDALPHRKFLKASSLDTTESEDEDHARTSEERPMTAELVVHLVPPLSRVLRKELSASAAKKGADSEMASVSTSVDKLAQAAADLASRQELATLLLAILGLPLSDELSNLIHAQKRPHKKKRLIKAIIEALLELVTAEYCYPLTWTDMVFYLFRVVLKCVHVLWPFIEALFGDEMDEEELWIWARFLRLCAASAQHHALQLEDYPSLRGNRIKDCVGDLRVIFMKKTKRLWAMFQAYRILLIPELTSHLIALATNRNKEVRGWAMSMYMSLLSREADLHAEDQFPKLEVATIQALEELSRTSHWHGGELRRFFDSDMKAALQRRTAANVVSPKTAARAAEFTKDMQSLLTLLSELRDLPSGAEYDEERAYGLTQLMTYLLQTKHGDAYLKYAHQLARMYEDTEQFVEASFAVLLHADVLDWSTKALPASMHFPAQLARNRKRQILNQALALFDRSKAWEHAISVLNQIIDGQRTAVFDYFDLSQGLRRQAELYEKIVSEDRFFPSYFYVAYYGGDFPKALRVRKNSYPEQLFQRKRFIYKGLELERIQNFIQRMQKKFPNAEILKSTDPIAQDLAEPSPQGERPGQYLHIFTVYPSNEDEMFGREAVVNPSVPNRVRKYLESNQVKVFHYSRPFSKEKDKKKTDNEFADLWIAKTFVVTEDEFPNIQRRLEIVETKEVILNPLQNAVTSMVAKNTEMQELIERSASDPSVRADRLTMVLNGILDAAVNGGPAKYISAFLSKDYRSKNKDQRPSIEQLENSLVRQLQIVGRGLMVHGDLCPDNMLALHSHMETNFEKAAELYKGLAGYSLAELKAYYVRPLRVAKDTRITAKVSGQSQAPVSLNSAPSLIGSTMSRTSSSVVVADSK